MEPCCRPLHPHGSAPVELGEQISSPPDAEYIYLFNCQPPPLEHKLLRARLAVWFATLEPGADGHTGDPQYISLDEWMTSSKKRNGSKGKI